MASGSSFAGLMVAVIATSIAFTAAAATNHIVGGSSGWGIPQSNPSVYSDWSSSNTFALGDTLEFKFSTGQHSVIHVTKAGYDSCNTTDKIGNVLTNGPATVNLNNLGSNYFICGFPGHCQVGQKLSITVASSTPGSAPAPGSGGLSPPTAGEPTPSTAPGSDSGKSAAAGYRSAAGFSFAVVVVSVASAFIF